jgi:hypothetical protein
MITNFSTKAFTEAIKTIQAIFSRSSLSSPTGNDMLLTCKEGSKVSTLEASEKGLYTKVILESSCEESGEAIINSMILSSLKLTGKDTKISLKEQANQATLVSGRFKADVQVAQNSTKIADTRPLQEVPPLFQITSGTLEKAFKSISFQPVGAQDPNLTAKLTIRGNALVVSANDNYRAAIYKTILPESIDARKVEVQVPISFMQGALQKIEAGAKIDIGAESLIRVKSMTLDVYSPVKQQSPDLEQDIEAYIDSLKEQPIKAQLTFTVEAATEAISSASSIVVGIFGNDVKLSIIPNEKLSIAMCSVTSQVGTADHSFDLKAVKLSEGFTSIPVSSKYILEFLTLLPEGDVDLIVYEGLAVLKHKTIDITLIMPLIA